MEAFIEILQENPAASAFGVLGLASQMIWPVFRAHRAIMGAQFAIGSSYSAHYALLEAWSGAGVAGIGATQSALAFLVGEQSWFRWAGLLFLPVVAVVCYATWIGLPTVFAFAAVALIMIGRLQRNTLRLRIFLLAASPFALGYDILVGAAPALVGGILSTVIATAMLVREIKASRESASIGASPSRQSS